MSYHLGMKSDKKISNTELTSELTEYFAEFVSDNKKQLIEKVLKNRTDYMTLVLEDIYQSQNASATLRTCECLGVQNIHIIENKNSYKLNPDVVMGSSKWIDLHRFKEENLNNTEECYKALRAKEYKIVATSPNIDSFSAEELPLDNKIAVVFGTEEEGLTEYALEKADYKLKLPMYGFTQSYNISVSVAIAFAQLINRIHQLKEWQLTADEIDKLRLNWYKKVVARGEVMERVYLEQKGK